MATKKGLANSLLSWQRTVDLLGLQDDGLVVTLDNLCGGLFNPEITFVEVTPEATALEIGQSIEMQAVIRCFNGTCRGDVRWVSTNPAVAEVTQGGVVTARSTGRSAIAATSVDLPGVRGHAQVTVGSSRLDIVFLFSSVSTDANVLSAPGDAGSVQHMGPAFVDLLNRQFEDYRIAVATFAHYPGYVSPLHSDCQFPPSSNDLTSYAPWEPFTPVLAFQWSGLATSGTAVDDAFRSLTVTCEKAPADGGAGPSQKRRYIRRSCPRLMVRHLAGGVVKRADLSRRERSYSSQIKPRATSGTGLPVMVQKLSVESREILWSMQHARRTFGSSPSIRTAWRLV